MMKNRLNIFILLIVYVLGSASCSGNSSEKQDSVVLSKDFQEEMWGRFDYLEASYNVQNAPMTANLVMEIEVSDVYPNIYPYHDDDNGVFTVAFSINAPDGSRRSRELNFYLKDKEGNFKSENVNGYYHFELPMIDEMRFNEAGDYNFKVENKYSKDPLYGIKKLVIKCLTE